MGRVGSNLEVAKCDLILPRNMFGEGSGFPEGESTVAPDFIPGRFDDRLAWSKYMYFFVIFDLTLSSFAGGS